LVRRVMLATQGLKEVTDRMALKVLQVKTELKAIKAQSATQVLKVMLAKMALRA